MGHHTCRCSSWWGIILKEPLMKIKIRKAKIIDIPSLVDKLFMFYTYLRDEKRAIDIAKDDNVLRGGIVIEVGNGFSNPNWQCVVAVQDSEIVAFIIGILEFCAPISEHHKCIRIHANYQDSGTMAGGKILLSLWSLLEVWAKEQGASYFYANIHPGNQPSVRAAKHIGFKHQYTQFYKSVTDSKLEDE